MTNLETNLLEVLTREAVRPRLHKMHTALKTFMNGFAKKVLTGPYGSYDNSPY